jgi:hypothetical protein
MPYRTGTSNYYWGHKEQKKIRRRASVAKEPKFRPQNTKGAEKFYRPEKSGAEFSTDLPKKGRTFLVFSFT